MPSRVVPIRSAPALPPRKPPVGTRRVALFEREVRYRLSETALELLLGAAQVLSEGQRKGGRWFGSSMITIDLAPLAPLLREPCDEAVIARVAHLLSGDARVQARARQIAVADAEERAGARLAQPAIELRFRARATRVEIDADVEAPL